MVDTIRFQIDLSGDNQKIFDELLRGEKITVGKMNFVECGDILKQIKTKEWVKIKLTSGSYDINYAINPVAMFVVFEFSVPKYLYGHNLYQCFPYASCDLACHLKGFIHTFLQNEFGIEVEMSTVKLLRIDLCLNLYFDTLEQKEDFMLVSEQIFSDLFTEGKMMRYDGTAMYKLREYSFKIYDKGKEFIKNDYKKLKRIKGTKEAARLGDLANRIARCELTLRHEKISYLFFNDLSRTTQCLYRFRKEFNDLKEHYNKVNRSLTNITRLFNRYRYMEINPELADSIKAKIKENIIPELVLNEPEPLYEAWLKMRERRHGDFTTSDFTYLIERWSAARMHTYNNYRAPKPILIETTLNQKRYNKAFRPEVLEFDKDLGHRCFRMFDSAILKIIQSCSESENPLSVLRSLQKVNPKDKQLASVYKYFQLAKSHSDASLKKRRLISGKTIKRIRKDYIPKINLELQRAGLPEIGKYKIKAFPATEIDRNTHKPL